MRDSAFIKYLRREGDVRVAIHSSPAGRLYLFGTDSYMKGIMFPPAGKVVTAIERSFHKGKTAQTSRVAGFLTRFFLDPSSLQHPRITISHEPDRTVISLLYPSHVPDPIVMDVGMFTPAEISVYRALLETVHGSTLSYGSLAGLADIPRGARFVGNAMAKNAFPILIPCHRVVRSDGSIGGYTGGSGKKLFLLNHEKSGAGTTPIL